MDSASADAARPHDDGADLGDLMHVVFRRLRRRWSAQLEPLGVTPHQVRALRGVAEGAGGGIGSGAEARAASRPVSGPVADDDGGVRLRDLAERLRIAPRSATDVVDQLESRGLVERAADPADRRAVRIRLTDAGRGLLRRVHEARRTEAADFFAVLAPADRAELARLLARVAANPAEGIE
ncbi:MarR family winged helix-turn-helix transcriptional regulator [Micrococcus endophyticus]|uniref:DNA-binding MarR family transcriptional regulator n=1 Tax=Micrococcus endophyticus TaxID=455343 RepID=A0A7W9N0U9_9MICC|nr:MarR family transcriptional regulator [Micrococcus endophyticus]MBB5849148.1 DNA-binding MarR family transcriptional regulator [Micrococcus endophyticus]